MLASSKWIKRLFIVEVCVLTASVLSVGQVDYQQRQAKGQGVTIDEAGADTQRDPSEPASARSGDADVGGPGSPAAGGATSAPGSSTTPGGGAGSDGDGTPDDGGPDGGVSPTPDTNPVADASYPHFGLVTQGVTEDEVLVGMSYNKSGCGDAGTYEAALGEAVVGDPEKAIDAMTRFVNDTGGIAGRTYRVVTADDGAGGCPEKAQAAAVELVDEKQVFLVIPGINDVGDYAASKRVPTLGGRDDPASIAKVAPNQLGFLAPLDPTFEAWTSFGEHYIDSPGAVPCLAHPDDADWNSYEEDILVPKARAHGFQFKTIVRYSSDASTAQQQANAAAIRMRTEGCDQVYFMDWNGIALIFLTNAATQNQFFPDVWTFTSYTALLDYELSGRLLDQRQWDNAIGLSARVPDGEHPAEEQCKRIYERYYPNDGNSESAAVKLTCFQIVGSAQFMRRGVALHGDLNADTFLLGANAINEDFYLDAHVPMDYIIEDPDGPFRTKAQRHFTVVDWESEESAYAFPDYPLYWEVFGPGKAGGIDLRDRWADFEPFA